MREILFRGKRKDTGEWVYGSYVYASKLKAPDGTVTKEIHTIVPAVFDENTPLDDVSIDPETIGQYTGIQDKNGVKIFEGDIVADDENVRNGVVYADGAFYADYFFYSEKIPLTDGPFKVISNIHDNPELLKEEE